MKLPPMRPPIRLRTRIKLTSLYPLENITQVDCTWQANCLLYHYKYSSTITNSSYIGVRSRFVHESVHVICDIFFRIGVLHIEKSYSNTVPFVHVTTFGYS